ncbi:MAG: hypothetical protein K2N25_07245 [Muribaculaceae bacterium]|nr:hypothetical protein [Muribaculaceae bacterium]
MRNRISIVLITALLCVCVAGCSKENKKKDRSKATQMYERICRLTEEYTDRLENAPDSADWASVCTEFEEKLDKITFSYPPDTDLLLTEGQNDTINILLQEYVKMRERRIHGLLNREVETDSLEVSDTLVIENPQSKES